MALTQVQPDSNVLERISDGVFVLDREWRFTYINAAGALLVEHSVESLMGEVFWEQFPQAVGAIFDEQYRGAMELQEPGEFDAYSPSMDRWYAVRTFPSPESLTVVFQDASRRRAADDAIRNLLDQVQRQRRLATVLAETNEVVFRAQTIAELFDAATSIAVEHGGFVMAWIGLLDPGSGNLTIAASAGEGAQEYLRNVTISARDDIYGRGISGQAVRLGRDLFTTDILTDAHMAPWRDAAQRVGFRSSGALPLLINGEVRGLLTVYAREPSYFNEDERILVHRLAANVAYGWEALQREEDLRESVVAQRTGQRFRAVLSSAPDAIIGLDRDGRIEMVNNRVADLFGWHVDDIVGQPIEALIVSDETHADPADWFSRLRRTEPGLTSDELRGQRRDGQHFPAEVALNSVVDEFGHTMIIVSVRDLTERLELEERRRQFALEAQREKQDRLDSLGRLASGVAHDFNNLLGVILNFVTLIEKQELTAQVRHDVGQVRAAAERGAALLRQLLTFARSDTAQTETIDLGPAVRSVADLISRTLGPSITIKLDIPPVPQLVRLNQQQLDQVVVNLALNARDAMPEGGRLWISTHSRPESSLSFVLRIRDSGQGMNPEVLSQIFEPFFTTKPRGQGTGLGLATVYGIVGRAGGRIDVNSQVGRGTTFEVHLPAQTGVVSPPDQSQRTLDTGSASGGRILLVEDNLELRDTTRRILRDAGYDVRVASDGREALDILADLSFEVNVVVSDVVMPSLGGHELADHLGEFAPHLPVILMSGDTTSSASTHLPVLVKPVSTATLLNAIEESLRDK